MFKKVMIALGVLLVLFVGGILVAPSFIDWNAQFPRIAAQVKHATGRDLSIGGRLEVRLLPTPTLTARDVTLSNSPGAGAAPMATLDAVEIRMALLPLLSGRLQVERIRLINPKIRIDILADGRSNLDFSPVRDKAPASSGSPVVRAPVVRAPAKRGAGLKLRFDNFKIVNATLIYHDARKNLTQTVKNLDATLRAASINGPFAAQGQGRVRGMPFSFDVSLGQVIAQRTVPLNAVVTGPAGLRAQISGAVLGLESKPRFKGTVKIVGDDLAAALDALNVTATNPAQLRQPFSVDATLDGGAQAVTLSALEIQLATLRMNGHVQVKMGKTTTFKVALKAARIDVDRLLRAPRASPLQAATPEDGVPRNGETITPPPPVSGGGPAQKGFVLPKDVRGTVSLNVDAVTLKGGLISDLRVNGELADGEFALNQFQFQAPGVSDVAVFGFLRTEGGKPQFDGNLEMVSSNPKGLADWLGVKMPKGVAGRLKRLSYKSKIAIDPAQVTLSAIRLSGDRTRVTGGVSVALRARPSFGADLTLDGLNLDTYAEAAPFPAGQAPALGAKAVPSRVVSRAASSPFADIAGVWTTLNALNDFDANLKLRLNRLTSGGRTFNGLLFDGTLYAGTLNIRALRLGAYKGASADLSGTFNGFGGVPEMSAVKIKADVKNLAVLGTSLGIRNIPKGVRALHVDARGEGSFLQPRLSVKVNALGGTYAVRGGLSFLPIGFGFSGDMMLRNGNTDKMLAALGYVPTGPLGALNLKGKLKTDGVSYDVSALTGTIAKTALSGTLSLQVGGAKPRVTADLKTGELDLKRFLAKAKNKAKNKTKNKTQKHSEASPANPLLVLAAYSQNAPTLRADRRWSRKRFDFGVLNAVDGEVTLKSTALRFGDYSLDDADIHAVVKDGILTADRVMGRLFGGPLSGTAVVRAKGQPSIETALKIDALDVGQAVKAIARQDLARGRLSLEMSFDADGTSPAELVSSLNGKGTLKIKALDVKKSGKGTALAPIIALVAVTNQFALPVSGKKKSGLADVSADFDLQDGVADVKDLALTSALGSGTGSGRIDIARWNIDFAGKILVEPNLLSALLSKGRVGREEVPFAISGRLDNPGVKLGIRPATKSAGQPKVKVRPADAFQEMLRKALPGIVPAPQNKPKAVRKPSSPPSRASGGELAPPPPQHASPPAPEKKLSPQEIIIRRLMKGL